MRALTRMRVVVLIAMVLLVFVILMLTGLLGASPAHAAGADCPAVPGLVCPCPQNRSR